METKELHALVKQAKKEKVKEKPPRIQVSEDIKTQIQTRFGSISNLCKAMEVPISTMSTYLNYGFPHNKRPILDCIVYLLQQE